MNKTLSRAIACFAAAILLCLTFSPYFMNGFWGDDSINSTIAGASARSGLSIWKIAHIISSHWMTVEGRFFPLGWMIGYHSFSVFQQVEYFRLYQTILTVLHVGLFAWLVFELSGNRRLAWLVMVGLPILFQVRDYHDPIGAYGGLCQYVGIILTGSALLLVKYCRTNRGWQLALASLLYGCGLLMYELTLVTLPLLCLIVPPRASIRRRVSVLWPFLLLTGLYLLTTLWLRHAAGGGQYAGTTPALDWRKWATAFGRQLFAAVPFSYWISVWHEHLDLEALLRRTFGTWNGWLLITSGLFLVRSIVPRTTLLHAGAFQLHRSGQLFAVSLVLLVAPAAMIALSKKYQDQLVWGIGYIPVYISYFGLALLAALALFWLLAHLSFASNRNKRTLLDLITVGVSLLIAGNRTINVSVAQRIDGSYKAPRDLIEVSARLGMFKTMANGDPLLITQTASWLTEDFLVQHTKRAIKPISLATLKKADFSKLSNAHSGRIFLLDYRVFADADRGWLMLVRVDTPRLANSNLRRMRCSFPATDYSLVLKSDRIHPEVRDSQVPLTAVDSRPNLLRRIYSATRAARYYSMGRAVGESHTPCPTESGELETVHGGTPALAIMP